MTLLWGLANLLFCGALATGVCRRAMPWRFEGAIAFALAWTVSFFSAFFGAYLLLGLIGLVTGGAAVRVPLAAGIQALACAAVLWRRRGPGAPAATATDLETPRGTWRAMSRSGRLLAGATVAASLALSGMLCFEFPRGYEPKAYHLPLAANVFQTSSLELWDREYMDTFPANASLYYGFLLAFLPERAVAAAEMPLLFLLLAALYGLGRATGADREASVVATCGAVTIPIVAFSSLECGADIGGIAFLAAAVFFALTRDVARNANVALAGLAAGIAFGFKSLHLVGAAFLLLAVAARRFASGGPTAARGRKGTLAAGLFGTTFLALAGVWLARNGLRLGNPLYPVGIPAFSKFLGWRMAPDIDYAARGTMQLEWVRSSAGWLVYPWVEGHIHAENFKHSSGLGAFFAGFVPPSVVAAAVGLFTRSPGRLLRAGLLAGAAVLTLVWWILGDRQPRYLMGAGVFVLPLVAWTIALAQGRARSILGWTACVTSLFMLGVVVSRQAVEVGHRVFVLGQWKRYHFYVYPPGIDRLPAGSTVANLIARTENWGLYGEEHRNRVVNSRRALRELGVKADVERPPYVRLDSEALRGMGASHLVALSTTELRPGPGVALVELDRFVSKPADSQTEVPVLYRVEYAGRAGACR